MRSCEGVFFQFSGCPHTSPVLYYVLLLGCPCTNLVGNLLERKTLVAIAKQKLTPIVKGPMCEPRVILRLIVGLPLYKPCKKYTGKKNLAIILQNISARPPLSEWERERERNAWVLKRISLYIYLNNQEEGKNQCNGFDSILTYIHPWEWCILIGQ